MRYAVRKTPRGPDLYPAAGAVGREAPGGTTEMVTLLWKSGEGAGEPSDGRRWRVWVSLTDGAGAGGSLASRAEGPTGHRVQASKGKRDLAAAGVRGGCARA